MDRETNEDYQMTLPESLQRANDQRWIPCMLWPREILYGPVPVSSIKICNPEVVDRIAGLTISPPRWYELKYECAITAAKRRGIRIGVYYKGQQVVIRWQPDPQQVLPTLEPTGGFKHIRLDQKNLRVSCDRNGHHLSQAVPEIMPLTWDESRVRFIREIMWRCRYIDEFMCHCAKGGKHNIRQSDFYPILGPDIEMDLWLFENQIILQKEPFSPRTDTLVRMYGFGKKELQFLKRERMHDEIKTLHCFHLLQACIGFEETKDIAEQMQFCFYAVRDLMADKISPNLGRLDVRREFDVAKFLVNGVWQDLMTGAERSPGPRVGRRAGSSNGNWSFMDLEEKRRVLRNDPDLMTRYY
ncbi:hypothetical protein HD806DRAFT_545291 [Xylariaceae sp. AK1471]|nr:hypothetical protein HD806DRAFT_545291 [Xylariaceae sp. AK1471]